MTCLVATRRLHLETTGSPSDNSRDARHVAVSLLGQYIDRHWPSPVFEQPGVHYPGLHSGFFQLGCFNQEKRRRPRKLLAICRTEQRRIYAKRGVRFDGFAGQALTERISDWANGVPVCIRSGPPRHQPCVKPRVLASTRNECLYRPIVPIQHDDPAKAPQRDRNSFHMRHSMTSMLKVSMTSTVTSLGPVAERAPRRLNNSTPSPGLIRARC